MGTISNVRKSLLHIPKPTDPCSNNGSSFQSITSPVAKNLKYLQAWSTMPEIRCPMGAYIVFRLLAITAEQRPENKNPRHIRP